MTGTLVVPVFFACRPATNTTAPGNGVTIALRLAAAASSQTLRPASCPLEPA